MYLWERSSWPSLTWEAEHLSKLLASVSRQQGRLLGRMEALGIDLRDEAHLQTLTEDVVKRRRGRHALATTLNKLLDVIEGKLTTSRWAEMARCSQDTAYRDILDLVRRGALQKDTGGGRSSSNFSLGKSPTRFDR